MHDSHLPVSPEKSGPLVGLMSNREVLGLVLILCVVGAVAFAAHEAGIVTCLFRRLTGLPCPCCGTTRACLAILRGEVVEALKYNPLAVVIIFLGPFALWLMTLRKVWHRMVVVTMTVLAWIAVLLNWAYLLSCDLSV